MYLGVPAQYSTEVLDQSIKFNIVAICYILQGKRKGCCVKAEFDQLE